MGVSVDLFGPCLIGEIIMAISDVINNARIEGAAAESMNRECFRVRDLYTMFQNHRLAPFPLPRSQ